MANVNKYQAIKSMTGIPSKGSILASGGDDVPALVTDQSGNPQAPASIKQGEIIFSVPSIVGAGQGDYDKGAELILELHEQLKELGEQLIAQEQGSQGIAGVPLQ